MKRLSVNWQVLKIVLLLLMFAQLIFASPLQSAAFDEGYSITYGYAYLRTGDARLSRGQNPPLTNVLLALPLLLRSDIVFPIDQPAWQAGDVYGFADEFLWKADADPQSIVMLARLAEMALALLLACVIYAFTKSLFGDAAALVALFLCAFDPNILAHGHIIGTDLGVTLFIFASVGLLMSALKRSSWQRMLIAGLVAGAALASKYSAVWLGPIVLLMLLSYPNANLRFSLRLKYLVLFGLAAFVVVWATFQFSFGQIDPGGLPLPAPQYWSSLVRVGNRVEASTPAFMLNKISEAGFWGYYPYVFLIKTPLLSLLGLLLGAIGLILRRDRKLIAFGSAPIIFFFAAIISQLNLGYRLILPALPFVIVLAGQGLAATWQASRQRWIRVGLIGLSVLLIIEVLSLGPSQIAYFNLFVLDRDRDYNYLVDSNLDWGQDLIALRDWQTANHIDQINLAYYGTARPAAYHVHANLLPSFSLNDFGSEVDGFNANALAPGWYAVSATSLQLGLLYTHWNEYAVFRSMTPMARVGRSLLIYKIEYPSNAIDRSVVLGPSAGDLDREALGGPARADRQLLLKWAGNDAAVFAMNGVARYLTRGGDPIMGFAPDVHAALIANAEKLGDDASGDWRIWQIDARTALEPKLTALLASKVQGADQSALKLPVTFEGGLAFLGYDRSDQSDGSIDLTTYWRVADRPTLPLSIFAHVIDPSDRAIAQADGLTIKLSTLETDDVLLQHFVIEHAQSGDLPIIELGIYDRATGRRMSVSGQLDHVILD